MSCRSLGTAEAMPRLCSSCRELEHGSAACSLRIQFTIPAPPKTPEITYRITPNGVEMVE